VTVRADCSSLAPMALVELFELDATAQGATQILRWHCGTTVAGGDITWQGQTYAQFPVEATGFEVGMSGKLPRPQIKVANIGGLTGAFVRSIKDGLGAKVTRRRTLAKYLDAVNFPAGNPTADPTAAFPDEIYHVARRSSENAIFIEFELATAFDAEGVKLPRRQVLATVCPWKYRGTECGYTGAPVEDANGSPTNSLANDACAKTLRACRARFGTGVPLPYGAFPSSLLMRSQ